jgi:hypothetical protein
MPGISALGRRFKNPAEPASGGNDMAGALAAQAAAETARRETLIAQAQAAQAQKEAKEAQEKLAAQIRANESEMIRSAIVAAASTPERRALNPSDVYKLFKDDFIIHEGRVVSKADPSKDAATILGTHFDGPGKYLLAPALTGTGAGVPNNPQVPPQKPPVDYSTDEGLTRRTRELTHKMFGTKPAAAPVAPPAAQPPPPVK